MVEESKVCMIEMQTKLDRICSGMDVMKDKQEEMAEDCAKIKEAVYNPDQGLYARLRELEALKRTSFLKVRGKKETQEWKVYM